MVCRIAKHSGSLRLFVFVPSSSSSSMPSNWMHLIGIWLLYFGHSSCIVSGRLWTVGHPLGIEKWDSPVQSSYRKLDGGWTCVSSGADSNLLIPADRSQHHRRSIVWLRFRLSPWIRITFTVYSFSSGASSFTRLPFMKQWTTTETENNLMNNRAVPPLSLRVFEQTYTRPIEMVRFYNTILCWFETLRLCPTLSFWKPVKCVLICTCCCHIPIIIHSSFCSKSSKLIDHRLPSFMWREQFQQ